MPYAPQEVKGLEDDDDDDDDDETSSYVRALILIFHVTPLF
jgi:hypothetical protein